VHPNAASILRCPMSTRRLRNLSAQKSKKRAAFEQSSAKPRAHIDLLGAA
jgi:hypothetical protein